MNYNETLKKLRSDKTQIADNIENLDKNKLKEIEEATQTIKEKYMALNKKSLNDLNIKTTEVYNYCKTIEKKSTMDKYIFTIMSELVSLFEGERYTIETLYCHKDVSSPASVRYLIMIIPQNVYKNLKNPRYIRERYYHHLLKNGIVIKISDDWSMYSLPYKFTFYKSDDSSRINPQISFKGFSYIKEFIDYVINYKIENNIDELTKEDMQRLKDEFIVLNADIIHNNYQLKAQQKIKQCTENINSEYKHKQKILKRIVKKLNQINKR